MSNNSVIIIAEAGVNHNGSIDIAKEMIAAAKESGANAIKFQTFVADDLVTKDAEKACYQKNSGNIQGSQFEMLKRLELSEEAQVYLFEYCKKMGIEFLSSPFSLNSVDFLNKLGLNTIKIPSGEITNYPYLCKIGKLGKKILLSCGMSDLGEIEDALDILTLHGTSKDDIIVLHCNTEYPTPFEDVNLRAMRTIQNAFNIKVGYSDHTEGILVPIAAVALGAVVIEKHFTLSKNMEGPDHRASIEPAQLKSLVISIRNLEKSLGDGIKKASHSELKNIQVARKSIIAISAIKRGELFTQDNIGAKRPGNGITPMRWNEVIGKRAIKDFNPDELIEL